MKENMIGSNIIKYRRKRAISQKELASLIDMTPQSLLKVEKGLVNPKADTLEKIMEALRITPNQLFGAEEYENVHLQIPFARNFRRIREALNLTKGKAGELLQITEKEITELEEGTLIPSNELMRRICDEFMVSESELTENSVYERNMSEVRLLEKVKERNSVIAHVDALAKSGKCHERNVKNLETGEIVKEVYTSDEQAKDYLLDILRKLTLTELVDVYKVSCDKEIERLTNDIL